MSITPGENAYCELRSINENDPMPCQAKNCNGNVIRELIQIIKQYIQMQPESLSEGEIDALINGSEDT